MHANVDAFLKWFEKYPRARPSKCAFVPRAGLRPPASDDRMYQLLDDFLLKQGLKPLHEHWVKLRRPEAAAAVGGMAWQTLDGQPRLKKAKAESLGQAFVSLFAPDAQFFTNLARGTENSEALEGWAGGPGWSATQADSDAGVVGLDTKIAGLLWYEESIG